MKTVKYYYILLSVTPHYFPRSIWIFNTGTNKTVLHVNVQRLVYKGIGQVTEHADSGRVN